MKERAPGRIQGKFDKGQKDVETLAELKKNKAFELE